MHLRKKHPGEVLEIESEEELDKILQEDKDSLTILLGVPHLVPPLQNPGQAPAGDYRPLQWLLVLVP